MVGLTLNVVVDGYTTWPLSLDTDASSDLQTLYKSVVKLFANLSSTDVRMFKPPLEVVWPIASSVQKVIDDAHLNTWIELEQSADLIEQWFPPSSLDPNVVHLLLSERQPFFSLLPPYASEVISI